MDIKRKKLIVSDLWRKKPKGTYSSREIFDLFLHSESALEDFLLSAFFDGLKLHQLGKKKSTLTRRKNIVWKRLSPIVEKIQRAGGTGVYEVKRRFSVFKMAYIFANDYEEANKFADTFLSHILHPQRMFQITFIEFGDVSSIVKHNDRLVKSLKKEIESCKSREKFLKKDLERLNITASTVVTIQEQQISVYN